MATGFFEADVIRGETFDVVYIGGLHTFDQTLRDLTNAISVLRIGGVIIIDDVLPISYAASIPSLEQSIKLRTLLGDSRGDWMGDVYRLVFFIENYLPAYSYATVQENHGQTILWRGPRRLEAPDHTVAAISQLDFAKAMLSLSTFKQRPMAAILTDIAQQLSPDR
jgi:hypothetical protein